MVGEDIVEVDVSGVVVNSVVDGTVVVFIPVVMNMYTIPFQSLSLSDISSRQQPCHLINGKCLIKFVINYQNI